MPVKFIRLFVYGLLMPKTASGLWSVAEESGVVFEKDAKAYNYGLYLDRYGLGHAYPTNAAVIYGQTILVPEHKIALLDMIEGGYDRVPVLLADGSEAQIYQTKSSIDNPYMILIEDGDYMPHWQMILRHRTEAEIA